MFVFTVLLVCLLQSLHGSWEDLPDLSHCNTPLLSTKISQSQNSTASNPPSNDSLNHSDNDCSLNHTYTDHSVNQSKQVPGLQHSRKDQSNSVSSIPMAPNKTDHVVSSEPKANAGSPNINGSDSNIVTNSDTSSIASNDGESQRVGSSDLPEETIALLNCAPMLKSPEGNYGCCDGIVLLCFPGCCNNYSALVLLVSYPLSALSYVSCASFMMV